MWQELPTHFANEEGQIPSSFSVRISLIIIIIFYYQTKSFSIQTEPSTEQSTL